MTPQHAEYGTKKEEEGAVPQRLIDYFFVVGATEEDREAVVRRWADGVEEPGHGATMEAKIDDIFPTKPHPGRTEHQHP